MNPDELRKRIDSYGVAKLAKAAKVAPTTIYSFMDRKARNMRGDTLAKVLKILEAPSDTLVVAGESYLAVPVYDIRAAAGAGALVEDGPPTSHQVFREQFLRRVTRAQISDLSVIQVAGDSMWDTLHDGDAVLVDRSVSRIVKDGIYVLLYDGELLIKRCQRDLSDDGVDVMSDNPKYKSYHIVDDDRLQVIGRVIWIGRVLG